MTEFPHDLQRALAELPREREPDPALEDRVVRAVFRRQRLAWPGLAVAAAAALLLVIARPWSPPPAKGQTYVLILSQDSTYLWPPGGPGGGHLQERRAEYARWADSLARLGKLDVGGRLETHGVDRGLFIIRAANDSEAASIAATCPHNKYHGRIEISRFIE